MTGGDVTRIAEMRRRLLRLSAVLRMLLLAVLLRSFTNLVSQRNGDPAEMVGIAAATVGLIAFAIWWTHDLGAGKPITCLVTGIVVGATYLCWITGAILTILQKCEGWWFYAIIAALLAVLTWRLFGAIYVAAVTAEGREYHHAAEYILRRSAKSQRRIRKREGEKHRGSRPRAALAWRIVSIGSYGVAAFWGMAAFDTIKAYAQLRQTSQLVDSLEDAGTQPHRMPLGESRDHVEPDAARMVGDLLHSERRALRASASPVGLAYQVALSVVLAMLGYHASRSAQRCASLSLALVTAIDERPPILLLRSFADDRLRLRASVVGHSQLLTALLHPSGFSYEELLMRYVGGIGPLIALGDPGEDLPPLGAAREYLRHQPWQERILVLVAQSAASVVVLAGTPSVAWEVSTAIASGARSRLIVVVPPVAERERERRWNEFLNVVADAQLRARLAGLDRTRVVAFRLSESNEPIPVYGEPSSAQHQEVALVVALTATTSEDRRGVT